MSLSLRILFIVACLLPAVAHAAPKAELWPRWEANDPASTTKVDHGPWRNFLATYVRQSDDGINRVAYAAVTPADRTALDVYVTGLAAMPVSTLNRDEQLAFWINLYNALTVQTVLAHYPVASIRDIAISPGLFARGPWGAKLVTVEGEPLSLDDIEHRIARPIWRDPRLHYAFNCASLGCPNLRREPFEAARLDEQLDMAAMAYINNPRGIWTGDGKLYVSSLYEWYEDDFGGDDKGVIHHLLTYADPQRAMSLQHFKQISGDAYNWALNAAP